MLQFGKSRNRLFVLLFLCGCRSANAGNYAQAIPDAAMTQPFKPITKFRAIAKAARFIKTNDGCFLHGISHLPMHCYCPKVCGGTWDNQSRIWQHAINGDENLAAKCLCLTPTPTQIPIVPGGCQIEAPR